MSPLEEAIAAKAEMGLSTFDPGYMYYIKGSNYIQKKFFLKDFPFKDNFYGLSLSLTREAYFYARDLYEHRLDWVLQMVFEYSAYNPTIFPYDEHVINDSQEYLKLIQSFYLDDIRLYGTKRVAGYLQLVFSFKAKDILKDGDRYSFDAVINCKMKEQNAVYYLWKVNFHKEEGDKN